MGAVLWCLLEGAAALGCCGRAAAGREQEFPELFCFVHRDSLKLPPDPWESPEIPSGVTEAARAVCDWGLSLSHAGKSDLPPWFGVSF